MAERGSDRAQVLWLAADRRVSSLLLYPEACAAVARAARMGRIARRHVAIAEARVEELWRAVERVRVTDALVRHAGELTRGEGLRGYDSVHLASALAVADAEMVVVAADGDLVEAAAARGLATAPLR